MFECSMLDCFFTVIVAFPLVKNPSVSLLAWTTTPWTLPSNLALCVNENLVYVKIKGRFHSRVIFQKMDRF